MNLVLLSEVEPLDEGNIYVKRHLQELIPVILCRYNSQVSSYVSPPGLISPLFPNAHRSAGLFVNFYTYKD